MSAPNLPGKVCKYPGCTAPGKVYTAGRWQNGNDVRQSDYCGAHSNKRDYARTRRAAQGPHKKTAAERAKERAVRYGLTVDQAARVDLVTQCAVSGVTLTTDKRITGRVVDHDHSSGQVRGVLSSGINMAIGSIEKIAELTGRTPQAVLQDIAAYLANPPGLSE